MGDSYNQIRGIPRHTAAHPLESSPGRRHWPNCSDTDMFCGLHPCTTAAVCGFIVACVMLLIAFVWLSVIEADCGHFS